MMYSLGLRLVCNSSGDWFSSPYDSESESFPVKFHAPDCSGVKFL